jgi:predicted nucleic acid-binding protein
MPAYLLDTNILLRLVLPDDPMLPEAQNAISTLLARGDTLHVTAQNFVEFWAVATRPSGPPANGLGLSIPETSAELARIKRLFQFLADSDQVFPEWERLVSAYRCSGKVAHDARLVAVMIVNGIGHLLTFNDAHFTRFTEITAVNPHDV